MTADKEQNTLEQKSANRRSLFIVAQEVGYLLLICGLSVLAVAQVEPGVEQVGGVARESVSTWSFLAVFAAMTLFVMLILKSFRGTKLLGAIFALAVLAGVATLATTLFGPAVGVLAFLIGAVIYYTNPHVISFNIVLALGLAGVSSSVGFGFHPMALLVVMALLAVYDVVAVYFTKHMVKLAKTMLRRKVFFAMILPEVPAGLTVRIADVGGGRNFAFLGTGDLVLPSLFAVSVASAQGVGTAVPVIIGAVAGLLLTNALFLWQPQRKPMPALPPIVIGSIAGYAITLLF